MVQPIKGCSICLTCRGVSVLDSLTLLAPIKRFHEEEIPMPEMWSTAQLVRKRGGRSDSKVPMWVDPLFVSGDGGRHYRDEIRSAGTSYNYTLGRNQDSKVSDGSAQLSPTAYPYWGNCGENWITRKRNGILSGNPYGPWIARTSFR